MAQVRIENVVDKLSSEFRKALALTFATHAPGAIIDDRQVFRDFKRNIGRNCRVWETVSDSDVQT